MILRWLAHPAALAVLGLMAFVVAHGPSKNENLADGLPFFLLMLVALGVGWLLAWKLPRNPLGWILLAIPALFSLSAPATLVGEALLPTAPRVATWIFAVFGSADLDSWVWLPPVWLLLSALPLHFPDGRLPSPRWRWFRWFTVVALVLASAAIIVDTAEVHPGVANPLHVPELSDNPWISAAVLGGLVGTSFIGSIASLFVRYRGAGIIQRAQLRWVLWSVAIAAAALILGWIVGTWADWVSWVALAAYALIPISVGVAVLRYRLYDIDRIISRTASYAIVTLAVVGTYAGVVLSVSALLPGLPSVGVALATLAAAAVFLPLLRWVRRGVDRLFNREQYDAERVVEEFGERLRNGADPHTAAADLESAVQRTLQPSALGIWTARR